MGHNKKNRAAKLRLLQSTALVAFVASAGAAQAQVPNTTGANVNVLNLLSPFLGLNGSAIGQSTLQGNLQQAKLRGAVFFVVTHDVPHWLTNDGGIGNSVRFQLGDNLSQSG